MEGRLSDPDILQWINVGGYRRYEDLPNLLLVELAECQLVAGQKLCFFLLRHPP